MDNDRQSSWFEDRVLSSHTGITERNHDMGENEKMIKTAAAQEASGFFDDDLSYVLEEYTADRDELDFSELEQVSAAGNSDYSKFMS